MVSKIQGWPPTIVTPVSSSDIARGDGEAVIDFIQSFCPQVKDSVGGRAGEPLLLRPWQRNLMEALFARRADGRLKHKTALIGLPRKSGKSALGSGIALFGALLGPRGGEVYSCAADRDQARIVFGSAKSMVEMSPELSAQCKLYRDAIEIPATGSVYRVLSSEAYTKEGLSPTLVIYDELHAAPNRELWDVMALAQAARYDALTLAITTAGVRTDQTGQDSVAYTLYQYAKSVASKEIEDASFFAAWWQADPEADHRDPQVWRAANPGYGDLQDPEDFEAAVKRTPENEWRTKRLNNFVSSQQSWLPNGAWNNLETVDEPTPGDAVNIVLGVDGSFSGDCTAIVAATVEESPRIWLVDIWEKQPTDRDDWRVDISEVEEKIMRTCGEYNVLEVAFDPFRWQRSMDALAANGVPIVEYPSTSPARMVSACAKFYDAVMSKQITHDGNPVLARHLDNCATKVDRLGPRIVKEHRGSPRKIDAAVSAVIAFDRATFRRNEPVEEKISSFFGS
jgi:phage terminase large subunit-like protein